jgi:hypothetical protein
MCYSAVVKIGRRSTAVEKPRYICMIDNPNYVGFNSVCESGISQQEQKNTYLRTKTPNMFTQQQQTRDVKALRRPAIMATERVLLLLLGAAVAVVVVDFACDGGKS